MVGHSRKNHQALIRKLLPSLHRTGGDKVVLRSETQYRHGERSQARLGHTPLRNHIHTPPMAAWVPWRIGRQQCRWPGDRSTDVGRIKAGAVVAKICQ